MHWAERTECTPSHYGGGCECQVRASKRAPKPGARREPGQVSLLVVWAINTVRSMLLSLGHMPGFSIENWARELALAALWGC